MNPTTPSRLKDILQECQQLLRNLAISGMLSCAVQKALQLAGVQDKLRQLVRKLSRGNFNDLPPIELLPAQEIPEAFGVCAISTGSICLNQDWLRSAILNSGYVNTDGRSSSSYG
jgi:hypothetical protein